MFSGIVEEKGKIVQIIHTTNLCVLKVKPKKVSKGTKQGDSVSVNGVCLTVTEAKKGVLSFDIMLETLRKTNLGELKKNHEVNLERALKITDRISGHFVSGHVDDMGRIKKIIKGENYVEMQITFKKELGKYIVPKGSICVDGVSLTVGEVRKGFFSIYLIPFTLDVTTLGLREEKDKVNLETDILAKYVLKAKEAEDSPYSYVKK